MWRVLFKAIAVGLVLIAGVATADAAKRAFVVGIDRYENLSPLAKAVGDARAIAAAFKDLGFAPSTLADAEANRLAFYAAWGRFLASIQPGDTVAVFFSGHGLQLRGINYLLPPDVPAAKQGEEVVRAWAINLNDLADAVALKKPAVALFIIDACRDNPFQAPDGKKNFGAQAGLADVRVTQGDGMFVMYSAGANEQALDWLTATDTEPNSVYTRRLLPLLKTPGLSLLEIAKRVQGEVAEDARTRYFLDGKHIRHTQRPAYYDGILGQYYLAGLAPGTAVVPVPPAAKGPQPPLRDAARDWENVKTSKNLRVLEAFRERHKDDPVYAALADEAIAAVRPTPVPSAPPVPPVAPARASPASTTAAAKRLADEIARSTNRDRLVEIAAERPELKEAAEARLTALGYIRFAANNGWFWRKPGGGEPFRDCYSDDPVKNRTCPEMVVVPAGSFMMGSPESEEGREADEGPQRKVTIAEPFAVGKFEVTFDEWDACVAGGGCKHKPGDEGWGRGRRPVIHVSWNDAKEYVGWLSKTAGQSYRLLTEAEWEYAARAGTTTPFHTGRAITTDQANYNRKGTIEVGSLNAPNAYGLHDMHGNVWEWVEDCYANDFEGAPRDGSAAMETLNCPRVLRGGSWGYGLDYLRAGTRYRYPSGYVRWTNGFRVARSLSR